MILPGINAVLGKVPPRLVDEFILKHFYKKNGQGEKEEIGFGQCENFGKQISSYLSHCKSHPSGAASFSNLIKSACVLFNHLCR